MASPDTVYGADSNIPNILGILRFAVLMVVTLLKNCDVSITNSIGCFKLRRRSMLLRVAVSSTKKFRSNGKNQEERAEPGMLTTRFAVTPQVLYYLPQSQIEEMPLKTNKNIQGMRSFLLALLVFPVSAALSDWSVPEKLSDKVDALNAAQRSFITSGAAINIVPERQLEHELATRKPESLKKLIDELMAVAEQMGYLPKRDMGAAPLNLTTDEFRWRVVTPPELRDMKREPGPFSVHRYLYPKSGVPTFGGAKVAIWPEDLVAGDVDVAIVGVPSNMSSGVRDARWAPDEMRALNTIATPDVQSLIKPFEVLSVVDYGDFAIDQMSLELSIGHITKMVAETAGTGAIPMLVGGDTSMLYPGVKGVASKHGTGSFGLLHFSAHPDSEQTGDHTISDRQAVFRLLDEGIVDGSNTIQVGLRGPDVDATTLQWLRDEGVRYHTMAEIRQRGFEDVLKRVLREVGRGPEAFFVSIDVSALAPTEMIAAGRAEVNGLSIEQVTKAIRHVCAAKDIVGFEITDLAPMMDLSRLSVMHANAVLNACLVGVAVRKAGLDPDYVHPLALDHGQR
ncbi:MAG: arginase family protein [Woeseiaceae bacterium]